MKNYKIVSNEYEYDFRKEVERNLANGWQLAGGVSVAVVPAGIMGPDVVFYQAMVYK